MLSRGKQSDASRCKELTDRAAVIAGRRPVAVAQPRSDTGSRPDCQARSCQARPCAGVRVLYASTSSGRRGVTAQSSPEYGSGGSLPMSPARPGCHDLLLYVPRVPSVAAKQACPENFYRNAHNFDDPGARRGAQTERRRADNYSTLALERGSNGSARSRDGETTCRSEGKSRGSGTVRVVGLEPGKGQASTYTFAAPPVHNQCADADPLKRCSLSVASELGLLPCSAAEGCPRPYRCVGLGAEAIAGRTTTMLALFLFPPPSELLLFRVADELGAAQAAAPVPSYGKGAPASIRSQTCRFPTFQAPPRPHARRRALDDQRRRNRPSSVAASSGAPPGWKRRGAAADGRRRERERRKGPAMLTNNTPELVCSAPPPLPSSLPSCKVLTVEPQWRLQGAGSTGDECAQTNPSKTASQHKGTKEKAQRYRNRTSIEVAEASPDAAFSPDDVKGLRRYSLQLPWRGNLYPRGGLWMAAVTKPDIPSLCRQAGPGPGGMGIFAEAQRFSGDHDTAGRTANFRPVSLASATRGARRRPRGLGAKSGVYVLASMGRKLSLQGLGAEPSSASHAEMSTDAVCRVQEGGWRTAPDLCART
ncbi:uncharacterized protein PSFLO_02435 [Pseudozyma flocculosa]|uniref:Uncharacterized protein n=1 Tax=Pseudozyma flocculosa TaxID=84751 RepID=A0A5C3EXF7_9BASI|nr:uncharacterized protein PSFLO_02435 [Pseudozyma flocculosa]